MSTNPNASVDFDLLQQVLLFKNLAMDTLREICERGQQRKIERGGFFFLQGDPSERLYLLLTGRVKLAQTTADGQSTLLRAIGPYSLFGLVVLAQADYYPVSAEAMEESTAWFWPKNALMEIVNRYPAFALNAVQAIAAHTQEFQERLRQMGTERVEHRLAHTLLRLASQAGKKVPEGILIDLPLTRQDLGEMIGATQYTVSRLLTQWESQGLIVADREHIVIRYPHGLVSLAES